MQSQRPQSALACRWYPDQEPDSEVGWAHVSGWAQLDNGRRRSLSCVVPVRNALPSLRGLLPALSDTLTECGYPWEIIVVDRCSDDGTEEAIAPWCQLPGYRLLIALDESVDRSAAIALGLGAARGDAAVLIDANCRQTTVLHEMVARWDDGNPVVLATLGATAADTAVLAPTSLSDALGIADGHAADTERLLLMDRTVLDELLR